MLLRLTGIKVYYDSLKALDFGPTNGKDASIEVDRGEIVVLLGPNGAGKSTVLKAIFGLALVSSGEVLWNGKRLKPNPAMMSGLGVSFVGQDKRVFPSMSVLENIEIGGVGISNRKVLRQRLDAALDIFPSLKYKLKQRAGELSGGQQQMVALARALISQPELLLLDEPSLGLSPKVLKQVMAVVKKINVNKKVAVVIVEHNIKSALDIADRAYIIDKGRVVFNGSADTAISSSILEEVFLSTVATNR